LPIYRLRNAGGELGDPTVQPLRHPGLVRVQQRGERDHPEVPQDLHPGALGVPVAHRPRHAVVLLGPVEVGPHLPHHPGGQEVGVDVDQPGQAQFRDPGLHLGVVLRSQRYLRPLRARAMARCIWRCASRRAMSCRLSYDFLPRANASSTFALPSEKYIDSGTRLSPVSLSFPVSRSISRRCSSSLRERRGSWLVHVPCVYSGMWTLRSHTSPSSIVAKASASEAFPCRRLFTSVPVSTMPVS